MLNPQFVAREHGLFGGHKSEDIRTFFSYAGELHQSTRNITTSFLLMSYLPIFSTNSDKSRFFAHILKRISFQCGILTTKEKIFCAIL